MPVSNRLALIGFALTTALAASNAVFAQPESPASTSAFTYRDVDQAWENVKKTNRPLLLFVSMNNCRFCDKMEVDTYAHPEIARGIDELFVTAKMKAEEDPNLIKQLGVRAFPTTLLISPAGTLIVKIEGYADPKKFVSTIRPALAAHEQAGHRTAALPDDQASDEATRN